MIIGKILKLKILLLLIIMTLTVLNPPFSKNVATRIGRYFLNLIEKHFPRDHKFHKISTETI